MSNGADEPSLEIAKQIAIKEMSLHRGVVIRAADDLRIVLMATPPRFARFPGRVDFCLLCTLRTLAGGLTPHLAFSLAPGIKLQNIHLITYRAWSPARWDNGDHAACTR